MQDTIFIQYTPKSQILHDESFLDLEFDFDLNEQFLPEPNFEIVEEENPDVSFQPFDILSETYSDRNGAHNQTTQSEQTHNQLIEQSNPSKKLKNNALIAKSKKTKNVCFNICQKTVKVMKTRTYDQKLQQISKSYGLNADKVIQSVLKIKNDLTGPKALRNFVQTEDPVNKTFKKFMKWFLEQKYLRHAINEGTMEDLKGYLKFKNQVVLNILEN